jgi:hypothetical protein
MSVYTQVFGGTTIYPSNVSYLALSLTEDVSLSWPLEANTGPDVAARIIDVTPSGAYSILMPPADQTGLGQTVLFNNLGPYTITVKDSTGATLISIDQGQQWQIYLTDNTTAGGTWRTFRYGAATAQAQASALAGYGLVAQGSVLSQNYVTVTFNSNYTAGASDRAVLYVWEGGVGTFSLPSAASVGNGFFVAARNGGSGDLTIDPAGSEQINGASTLVLRPGDSAVLNSDGVSWFTIGLGQEAVFAFDYTSIDLTGQSSPYVLSGAELNRISYKFIGTLVADMVIQVPGTTQQYWVDNATSGSYTLGLATPTQVPAVNVVQGARGIFYSNGSEVVNADTAAIATPIAIADGGTGATSAGGALINLGGTTVGIAVFTAANASAARMAMDAVGTDDAYSFAVAIS